VIVTEKSYTSKASFLDMDEIPLYKEECETEQLFNGKRINRGLYKSIDENSAQCLGVSGVYDNSGSDS